MNNLKKNILAGIIVYRPEKNLLKLVQLLLEQKVDIFLFINERNSFSDALLKNKKINYFNSDKNVGISISLNKIIQVFMKNNYEYLFTFDQDSMIEKNYVQIMIRNFENVLDIHKNAVCFSPSIIDEKFNNEKFIKKNISKTNNQIQYKEVNFAITSGSLFVKESFLKVGEMNEKLFIDGVDMDWCERAKLCNTKLFKSNNIFLKHRIGQKFINFFGIKKSYHQLDIRVYYIIRNSIYLILYGKNRIIWKFIEFQKTIIRIFAYPILSLKRRYTFLIILLALKDGFIKKMGKMEYINH